VIPNGRPPCRCQRSTHLGKLVVITGGPGAGKTAVLEMVRRRFCEHVAVLPEAAGIVYGGGFPRRATQVARCAAQRAIFRVQRELETIALGEGVAGVALCDRGTLDGLAYWPASPEALLDAVGTTLERELARYAAVIHLRVPDPGRYNHQNPLRIENAREAAAIDERIRAAWSRHPHVHVIPATDTFVDKVQRALAVIGDHLPDCCRT
jgi:predicted ATPase